MHYDTNPIEPISHTIYNDFVHNFNNIEYLRQRAIITPRNKTVDEINEYILSLVPMELKTIIAMIQYFHHPDT